MALSAGRVRAISDAANSVLVVSSPRGCREYRRAEPPNQQTPSDGTKSAAPTTSRHHANRPLRRARRKRRIGPQRLAHLARPWRTRLPARRVLRRPPLRQFRVGHVQVDAAVRDVELDRVALAHQADRAPVRRLGGDVADRQPRRAAGEPAVGYQRAHLAELLRLQVAGRIQHLLHPRPALRPLVADQHHVARRHAPVQDRVDGGVLALEHPRRPLELQDRRVHPGRLHDAAVLGQVAVQHRETAILAERRVHVADDAAPAVGVQLVPAARLAEGGLRRHAAGSRAEELGDRGAGGGGDVPAVQRRPHRRRVDGGALAMHQAAARQHAQDAHDAARAMHVLHMHVRHGGGDLADHRHAAAQAVDVGHGEVDAGLLCRGQKVQHGVGRAAHRDVERHRVLERLERGDAAGQGGGVVLAVPALAEIDHQPPGLLEQPLAVAVGRQRGAVAGQRQPQRLVQAVHRVGGEHARARAAGRARRALDHRHVRVADGTVGGGDHGVHEVDRAGDAAQVDLARLHRPAGDEHGGDVDPEGGHQHPGRDLVAVGDAHHRVGAVRVDHVLDAVGDQLARRQGVQHPVVAHGDAVVDRDGVHLLGDPAGGDDLGCDDGAEVAEVDVAGHELGEAVDDGHDRLAEVAVLHAGGPPKSARTCHVAAVRSGAGAELRHGGFL